MADVSPALIALGGVSVGAVITGWVGCLNVKSNERLSDSRLHHEREMAQVERQETSARARWDFQRTTLLELQDALSDFFRDTGRAHRLDVDASRQTGSYGAKGVFPEELDERINTRQRRVMVLSSRVEDDEVRSLVGGIINDSMSALTAKSEAEADTWFMGAVNAFGRVNDRIGESLRQARSEGR